MSCVAEPGRKTPKTERKSKPEQALHTHARPLARARLSAAQIARRENWSRFGAATSKLTVRLPHETRAELDLEAARIQAATGRRTTAYHVLGRLAIAWAAERRAARGETGPAESPAGNVGA